MPRRSTTLEPRKTPRQLRSVETRSRILDAAARVFAERGYTGTTNQIAAEAGLSIGSLYQYFPNKDSILVDLIDRHLVDSTNRLLAAADRFESATSLEARVRLIIELLVESHLDSPRLHQVLFEEAPRPTTMLERLHGLEREATRFVHDSLLDDARCRVADRDLAARMVVVTAESLVHRFIATPAVADLDVEAFIDEATRMIVAYITE